MSMKLLDKEKNLRLAYLQIEEARELAKSAGFLISVDTIKVLAYLNDIIIDFGTVRGIDKDDAQPDAKMYKIRKEFYNGNGILSIHMVACACEVFNGIVASADMYKVKSVTTIFEKMNGNFMFDVNFHYKPHDVNGGHNVAIRLDYCGIVVADINKNSTIPDDYIDACKGIFIDTLCDELR